MRLHEAAPKLIIQEWVGDKVKVSSYWPVPELTRAELALGRLQQCSTHKRADSHEVATSSLARRSNNWPWLKLYVKTSSQLVEREEDMAKRGKEMRGAGREKSPFLPKTHHEAGR